jgi:ketosteroid isomerase-like protein
MPRLPAVALASLFSSPDDVEAAFYEALQKGDIDALMALWADDDEVVCVHPGGGGRLVGPAAIRASRCTGCIRSALRCTTWPSASR